MSTITIYKHLPFPAPEGLECGDCDNKGVTGDLFESAGDPRPDGTQFNLLVDVLCPTCLGGRHPDHDPGFNPTPDDGEWNTSGYRTDEEEEQAEAAYDSCPSCHGLRYWLCDGFAANENGEGPEDGTVVQLVMPCGCSEPLLVDAPAPAVA